MGGGGGCLVGTGHVVLPSLKGGSGQAGSGQLVCKTTPVWSICELQDWFCSGLAAVAHVPPPVPSNLCLTGSIRVNFMEDHEGSSPPPGFGRSLFTHLGLTSPAASETMVRVLLFSTLLMFLCPRRHVFS